MSLYSPSALADERIRDLQADARHRRLLALASCCRPAAWHRAASRLRAALRSTPACATC